MIVLSAAACVAAILGVPAVGFTLGARSAASNTGKPKSGQLPATTAKVLTVAVGATGALVLLIAGASFGLATRPLSYVVMVVTGAVTGRAFDAGRRAERDDPFVALDAQSDTTS